LKQCHLARPYVEMVQPLMGSYPEITAFSIRDRINPHVFRKPVNALSPNHFSIRSFHTDQPFFGSEPDFSVFSGCKTANSLRGIGQWMIRPNEIDFLRIEFEPVQPLVGANPEGTVLILHRGKDQLLTERHFIGSILCEGLELVNYRIEKAKPFVGLQPDHTLRI